MGTPAGAVEEVSESRRPTPGPAQVTPDRDPLVRRHPQRVERVDVLGQPVADPLAFGFEGAEQPVPDDQDAAVVLVQVLRIGSVVYPVVRRGVHHELDWCPELPDPLGVDEELVEQADGLL